MMSITHHYLFFIQKNEVKVFRFKNTELSPCMRDGLPSFSFISWDELWKWWKIFSGVTRNDTIDFMFVSDNSMEISLPTELQHKNSSASCWGRQILESFFKENCAASKIDLYGKNDSKIRIKDTLGPQFSDKDVVLSFYTEPPLENIVVKPDGYDKGDTLYDYFHEKNEEDRERNSKK